VTQDIRIPDIGDADDVEVVEIIAAAGDEVGEEDPIIVIESDKASMEVPAGQAGTIAEITVSVGDKVAEGQVIAKLKDAESAGDDDGGDDDDDDQDQNQDNEQTRERSADRESDEESRSGERSHRKEESEGRGAKKGSGKGEKGSVEVTDVLSPKLQS